MLFSQKECYFLNLPFPSVSPCPPFFPIIFTLYLEKPLHHLTPTPLLIPLLCFPLPPANCSFQFTSYCLCPVAAPGPGSYIPVPLNTSLLLKSRTNCIFLWPHSLKPQDPLICIFHIRRYAGSRESKITKIESQMR